MGNPSIPLLCLSIHARIGVVFFWAIMAGGAHGQPATRQLANLRCGPQPSFAGLSFASPFLPLNSGGAFLRLKDQDFSVSKSHHIIIKDERQVGEPFNTKFSVSHIATEIKTNLDKTMFQEASQTAAELKRSVPGSRYILLCEFLDMTPITTKLGADSEEKREPVSDIDTVVVDSLKVLDPERPIREADIGGLA
jgi:hypothetical protein